MLTRINWLLNFGLLFGIAVGCGRFEGRKESKKEAKSAMELAGKWSTECLNRGFLLTKYQREEYKFSPTTDFQKNVTQHSDAKCKDEVFQLSLIGNYDTVGDSKEVKGARKINFEISKVTAKSFTKEMTDKLNAEKYCDIDDWKTNHAKNVTSRNCNGDSFDKGEVIYDIYKIKDKKLELGKSLILLEGLGIKKRPTQLDQDRKYAKS